MQNMRKLLLILTMLAASAAIHAEVALKLELTDGQTALYLLSEKPVVTFSGQNMEIATSEVQATYLRSDVARFTFEESTAVEAIDVATVYSYSNGVFAAAGQQIAVYSLNGQLITKGADQVSLEQCAPGVYIVKAGEATVKIMK